MSPLQHLLFKILLAICAACVPLVLVGIVVMERSAERNGGGEMVHSIGLLVGLMLIGYYAVVLLLGILLRRQDSSRWGWYYLAAVFALAVVPAVFLWQVLA